MRVTKREADKSNGKGETRKKNSTKWEDDERGKERQTSETRVAKREGDESCKKRGRQYQHKERQTKEIQAEAGCSAFVQRTREQ